MQYDLVFEGGGAKGIVFVGALEVLLDPQKGNRIRRLVGTSAGAITAALVAAGYSPEELLRAVNEKVKSKEGGAEIPRFETFMDVPQRSSFSKEDIDNSLTAALFKRVKVPSWLRFAKGWIRKNTIKELMKIHEYRVLFSFVERGGLYVGDEFLEWLEEKLATARNKDGNQVDLSKATFAEFNQQTGCHLSVVASDTTSKEMLVLNHLTAPDCPVAWGVRMSMSIPFIWQEVRWQSGWGTYRKKEMTGHTIVDGGALSNFPLDLIISDDEDITEIMGDFEPGAEPLGLLIDEKLPVEGVKEEEDLQPADDSPEIMDDIGKLKTVRRIRRLMNTMMKGHDRLVMEAYEDKVCHLPAKGYGTTDFGIDDDKREALIEAGKKAMRSYLGLPDEPGVA